MLILGIEGRSSCDRIGDVCFYSYFIGRSVRSVLTLATQSFQPAQFTNRRQRQNEHQTSLNSGLKIQAKCHGNFFGGR
ncbi:MAG: hypothetical protein HC849_24705 [Oscillatoriales cyanobacterium RU_3_3]|nr:hypothetical protein [Oscillatoriales cyanobacterium RU_3_3]